MAPNFAQRIKPTDPQRFSFALGVYQAAAALKGPAPNPEQFSINIAEEDGSRTKISFVDRPENRGMLAVKEQFPDPDEFQSMAFRILSFGEVLQDQKLSKMGVVRRDDTGNLEVHDSVIYGLATTPFRKSGKLDRPAFIAAVKSKYEKMEADEDDGGAEG
jgi:hypothetical protein